MINNSNKDSSLALIILIVVMVFMIWFIVQWAQSVFGMGV